MSELKVRQTPEGIVIGEGIDAILIRGKNLSMTPTRQEMSEQYPNVYPFTSPKKFSDEDILQMMQTDKAFPANGTAVEILCRTLRLALNEIFPERK